MKYKLARAFKDAGGSTDSSGELRFEIGTTVISSVALRRVKIWEEESIVSYS